MNKSKDAQCATCGDRGRVPVRDDRSNPGGVHGMKRCPDCIGGSEDEILEDLRYIMEVARAGAREFSHRYEIDLVEEAGKRVEKALSCQREALSKIAGVSPSNTGDPSEAANIMRHEAAESLSSTWPNYREDVAP